MLGPAEQISVTTPARCPLGMYSKPILWRRRKQLCWQSTCLASLKPWVLSPTPPKLCVVGSTPVFLAPGKQRQEDPKFKVILGQVVSLWPAWTPQDPISKKTTTTCQIQRQDSEAIHRKTRWGGKVQEDKPKSDPNKCSPQHPAHRQPTRQEHAQPTQMEDRRPREPRHAGSFTRDACLAVSGR